MKIDEEKCIMPEMPYCPSCPYGSVVYDEDSFYAGDDIVYTEWLCSLGAIVEDAQT